MADYTYSRKTKYLFDPASKYPFKLSRTKIDMFLECPRCFYLDRRLGVSKPSMPAFTLNVAVDALLKKEFDIHRAEGSSHPLMKQYGVDAVPLQHEKMDQWRENFVGVQYVHPETNFLVFGAVDDLWVNPKGEVYVVDYKATSKDGEIFLEDTKWHNQYRRQMEVYQWLLRHNGLKVSDTGYFVYVNGKKDRKAFDGKLEFDVKIIPYTGSDKWVENAIIKARKCLDGALPPASKTCEYCLYKQISSEVEREHGIPAQTVKKSTMAKTRIKKQPATASTLF
jgi:hypothetical protein